VSVLSVVIEVTGVPKPQGNKTVYNGHVVEGKDAKAREAFKSWRGAVTDKARAAAAEHGPFPDGPLHLAITFWMPKPASARKGERWAWKRPDIDKLERAVLDALTQSGLIRDDSRVCSVAKSKLYAIDRAPGVLISIAELVPL
jgi:crossover junction endodeoxyribonuclease RusA